MARISIRALLYGALIFPFFVLSQQQVLSTNDGLLRRFHTAGNQETENLLHLAHEHDLDVWQVGPSYVDIYTPQSTSTISKHLMAIPHNTSTIYRHNQNLIQWNLTSFHNSSFHSVYHPLHEITSFIYEISSLYPDLASTVHLGHSAEQREIRALKISRPTPSTTGNRDIDPAEKLGFVLVGAIHAREWIATSTSLYLAHALVANSSEPGSLTSLLDTYDFYIIPTPNPDGYTYTWEVDRFWYKNRQLMGPHEHCVGLDMNRNWGYKWKAQNNLKKENSKTSKLPIDPCSHWFPGHRAFESPEVNIIANYMTTLPNLIAFIDLRSYGQMLSSPYSFSCKRSPKDHEDQTEAGLGSLHALKSAYGTTFSMGRLCETLYPSPGNMVDWMYARVGIKYSYAAHLRDTGTYGFSLPPEWIRPVGEETARMVEYLGAFIARQLKR